MMRALSLVLLVAACGSKQPAPATSTTSSEPSHTMPAEHHEMESLPPELAKFHDVLAPHWHADKGPQRMKDTCAAMPDFESNAQAVAKATPPTTANADTWTNGTRQLVDAVSGLDASCKSNDAAAFEIAFTRVHESFHGLLAQTGAMEHHEEGEKM